MFCRTKLLVPSVLACLTLIHGAQGSGVIGTGNVGAQEARSTGLEETVNPPEAACKQPPHCSRAGKSDLMHAAAFDGELMLGGSYPQGEDNINVQNYDLRFHEIDFVNEEVQAEAIVTIKALERLDTELVLDFRGFTISQILLDGAPTTFTRSGENNAKLHIDLPYPVEVGETVLVTISYSGAPTPVYQLGLIFTNGSSGEEMLCTMAEPNGAHLWFPCNDRPDDKTTLDLYATVEDGRQVASNGELVSETVNAGMRTFHWQETHLISTYLIVMNAGDFTRVDVGGASVPLSGWFETTQVASGTAGLNMLPGQLTTFEDMFGPYPFDKYGHAEFPGFDYGGMEHQSLTTLHPAYLASRWVIAHELGHMWWGDLVGPASWDDLWLNEGFARYCEHLEVVGKDRDAIGSRLPGSIDWSRALNDPDYNNLFKSSLVYNRGAWTLHHLRSFLGEEKFWPALLHYRNLHEFSSATSEDLKTALEESSGIDLGSLYNRFIYNAGVPTISLYYFCDKRPGLGSRVMVRYERTDGFTCSDVAFVRLNFTGGESRVVRCVWEDPETYSTAYDDRDVISIEINPLDDYPGTITSDGTLSENSADGDTLPDGWELATLGTTSYGDNDDPDGDGFTNSAEHEGDTNPADASSAPVIASIALQDGGSGTEVELSYNTSLFVYYTIETTTTQDDELSWTTAEPKTRGSGETIIWSQLLGGNTRVFYRLLVEKQ